VRLSSMLNSLVRIGGAEEIYSQVGREEGREGGREEGREGVRLTGCVVDA